ncbi:MAG: PQQ-dependent sugar dehydrogenase, partial [Saprospiraceae bacterium]|nr:PQQ-dependent sugar dehydrogenase [Saprospiraceae bacterium]
MKMHWLWFPTAVAIISGCQERQDHNTTYQTYCSGCHGSQLQGTTSAAALIKPEWKDHAARDSITASIRDGTPMTTMIAWGNLLTDHEIEGLVDFILMSQDKVPTQPRMVTNEVVSSEDYPLLIEPLLVDGLQTPWAIEFVDASTALISEKLGKLKWLVNNKLDTTSVKGLPQTHLESSTGGYMDIALDPNYRDNGWIYLSYSHTNGDMKDKNALALTKIVRGKIKNYQWVDQQPLFEVPDSLMVIRGNRWGCRFLFDDEKHLFFTIGDMAQDMDSQDPGKATGKVFRIHRDGSIPRDNPFVNQPGAISAVFTVGNRNVQGLAIHPVTRAIWATEHGPKGGDELNILRKGLNYGWPIITYGIDYTDEIISDKTHAEGLEQPVWYWTPSIAVCSAEFCTSPLFPRWENNLLVGSLAFQELHRLVIEDDRVLHQEIVLKGKGRIRDMKFGYDGGLYILMNDP